MQGPHGPGHQQPSMEPLAAQRFAARQPEHMGHMGAKVRRSFLVRSDTRPRTPLQELMSARGRAGGGRGGQSRVKLLLTLWWVCTRRGSDGAHSSSHTAGWWAEMIGINDPKQGPRVIGANFKELAARGHIELIPGSPGRPATVRLLDGSGAGTLYIPPEGAGGDSYFRIPEQLWTTGAIGKLSGPGIVMYLILLELYRASDPDKPAWFIDDRFRERYGLSRDTRLAGINNLYTSGLVYVTTTAIDPVGEQDTGRRRHQRRLITLIPEYRPPAQQQPPSTGAP